MAIFSIRERINPTAITDTNISVDVSKHNPGLLLDRSIPSKKNEVSKAESATPYGSGSKLPLSFVLANVPRFTLGSAMFPNACNNT
ncbi:MAG: hypothetical protein ACI8T1_004454 [Verrucomicrobiales bacterium]